MMLICDTHCDTLAKLAHQGENCFFDVTAEMLSKASGDIRVQAMALFIPTGGMERKPTAAQLELQAFEKLKKQGFRQIRKIEEALPGKANALLTIEGGEAFEGNPDKVDEYAGIGVRMAAIVWNNENGLAHPAVKGSGEGLTVLGKNIVVRMRACHMAVDLSHLNEAGFWEVMESDIPPLASHSCAKALCDHPRNLNDQQLKELFRTGGFVGVNFYADFLSSTHTATLDTVVDHMVHMCDLGGEDCVGFGSDFDGIDAYPRGLRTAADIPELLNIMRKRGFDENITAKIAGLNFQRYLSMI